MASNNDAPKKGRSTGALPRQAVESAKHEILRGVGYERPPVSTRFKKGQSGNPKGRPKKKICADSPETRDLILREARRLVTIREGEESHQISKIEGVIRAQYVSAIKGNNAYAQKHVIESFARAEQEHRSKIAEDVRFWTHYVETYRSIIEAAEKEGQEPPSPLPHPDDVVIDEETGVRFIGPTDEAGLMLVQENCALRDVLIMQDALDHRLAGDTDDEKLGTALLFATVLDQGVPKRFRLSDVEFALRTLRYRGTPKRRLLREVRQAWAGLGRAVPPRGWTMPPLEAGMEILEASYDAAGEFLNGGDPTETARSLLGKFKNSLGARRGSSRS